MVGLAITVGRQHRSGSLLPQLLVISHSSLSQKCGRLAGRPECLVLADCVEKLVHGISGTFSGVLEPLTTSRSSILERSERSIFHMGVRARRTRSFSTQSADCSRSFCRREDARSRSSIFSKAAVEFNLGSDSREQPASLRPDNPNASQRRIQRQAHGRPHLDQQQNGPLDQQWDERCLLHSADDRRDS